MYTSHPRETGVNKGTPTGKPSIAPEDSLPRVNDHVLAMGVFASMGNQSNSFKIYLPSDPSCSKCQHASHENASPVLQTSH